jgi:hypothetical protein
LRLTCVGCGTGEPWKVATRYRCEPWALGSEKRTDGARHATLYRAVFLILGAITRADAQDHDKTSPAAIPQNIPPAISQNQAVPPLALSEAPTTMIPDELPARSATMKGLTARFLSLPNRAVDELGQRARFHRAQRRRCPPAPTPIASAQAFCHCSANCTQN